MKKIIQTIKNSMPSNSYIQYANIFDKLDVAGTSQKLKLEEKGRVAGQAENPPTNSNSNDAVENKIISIIEAEKDHSYNQAVKEFSAYRSRLTDLGIETLVKNLKEGKETIKTDIRAALDTGKDSTLYSLSKDVVKAHKDLDNFRQENMLSREPHYKESKLLGWAIIIFVFLIESVLNGYFFAKGHELRTSEEYQLLSLSLLLMLYSIAF